MTRVMSALVTACHVSPGPVHLGLDDVHVWQASLHVPGAAWQSLWCLLGADEQLRAGRFRADRDRRRFVAAHGIVRMVLSRYCEVAPAELRFEYGSCGKPGLVEAGIHFNISHADELLLCAVARQRQVGVDVERVRPGFACEQVARQIFSAREREIWEALSETDRPAAFFRAWVRKEAYVKATGMGLSFPVRDCEALLTPDQCSDGNWEWQMLNPAPGYVGALVIGVGRGQSQPIEPASEGSDIQENLGDHFCTPLLSSHDGPGSLNPL